MKQADFERNRMIEKSLVNGLCSTFHSRIKYPKMKSEAEKMKEEQERKSANGDYFLDETNSVGETKIKEIEGLLQFAAGHLELPEDTEMSVTFMDNAAIQEINQEYRGKDMPTDVISFAFEEETDEELSIIFDEALEELPRDLEIL